jgi:hypothetical protein
MDGGFLLPAVKAIGGVIFAFTLIVRIMFEITERCVRAHSRYTYVEIGLKDIIVSLYAGSFTHRRETTTLRRMFVIPLEEFEAAEIVKDGKVRVTAKTAAIREYVGNSDRLGYYFVEGTLHHTENYYQCWGFTATNEMFIPQKFENKIEIIKSIYSAKERFDNLPPPKPYVFKEMAFIKTRKMREIQKRMRDF